MSILNTVKTPIFITFTVLLTLFVFTKIFGPIPFSVTSVTTNKSDLFTVEGVGEASGKPTTASFTVGVNETASTAESAQEQANTTTNTIIDALKKLNIKDEDIKTSNYSVNPVTDFTSPTQRTTGYSVNSTIEVTVDDVELANKALTAASSAGANVVNGVSFVLSDDDRENLEKEARKKAITDAKEKAEELSQEVGIKLGRVMNIYVNTNTGMMPYDKISAVEGRGAGGDITPVNLQPGENTVRIQVSISYETL